jgi:hypothetical protein
MRTAYFPNRSLEHYHTTNKLGDTLVKPNAKSDHGTALHINLPLTLYDDESNAMNNRINENSH